MQKTIKNIVNESIKVDFNLFVAFSKIEQEIQNRNWFCSSPQHFMYFKSAYAIGETSSFETVVTPYAYGIRIRHFRY